MSPVLSVKNLHVDIPVSGGLLRAVQGISFDVNRGETFCIVGESGSGKSISALAIMDLLPKKAIRRTDSIVLAGERFDGRDERRMRNLRGRNVAMIFQEPMTSLNPSMTIGAQMVEVLLRHKKVTKQQAKDRAVYLLEKVGITAASSRLSQFPHQLSGGLRQRVMIAMSLMCEPEILIADEPTTALDVTIQAQILQLLADIQKDLGLAIVFITHDLGVVARIATQVGVMYAGKFVEVSDVRGLFKDSSHPYTKGLLSSLPLMTDDPSVRLGTIPGIVPDLTQSRIGCDFHNRCPSRMGSCETGEIPLFETGVNHSTRCLLCSDANPLEGFARWGAR